MPEKAPMPPKGDVELYEKAVELHKSAYKRVKDSKEAYKIKLGHMLQHLFGKSVWTLKDLRDEQLEVVIDFCEKKIEKNKRSVTAPAPVRYGMDTIMVSHGNTTHSVREIENCKSCTRVMAEFEEAKKNGTLDKILNNEKNN